MSGFSREEIRRAMEEVDSEEMRNEHMPETPYRYTPHRDYYDANTRIRNPLETHDLHRMEEFEARARSRMFMQQVRVFERLVQIREMHHLSATLAKCYRDNGVNHREACRPYALLYCKKIGVPVPDGEFVEAFTLAHPEVFKDMDSFEIPPQQGRKPFPQPDPKPHKP